MPEHDYVIVGAGSAGCVMAARLAEGGHRVLLLEAGGSDRRLRVQVPIGYGLAFHDPRLNWRFHTEPEPSLNGRAGYWPRGKVLGGSSAINAMVWVRGLASDYDRWRDAGNPGWGFADVLPAFKRLERFATAPDPLRGHDGPVAVSDVSQRVHPLCAHWLGAARDLGLPVNAGFNGASAEGLGLYEINVGGGVRQSAARAYLRPALRSGRLQVATDALALRVDIEGRRAVAVHYRRGGLLQRAMAAREVIVCAGAVQSPLLLQASGVGPGDWLQALGVPLRLHSPAVGRHLQDHLCVDHLYRSRVPTLNDVLRPWSGRVRVALQYLLTRRGPLAMSVNQGGGFVRSGPDVDEPDLQLYFSPLSYTRAQPGRRALMSPDPFPGFLLSAQVCRPTSRGQVRLRHPEGVDAPLIEPHSLATAHDIERLVRGVRWLHRLAATPSLARVIDRPLQSGSVDDDDGVVEAQVRQLAGTVFHACGTCRMGPDPASAVVDARLRVYGLQGLRVVDASVFPSIPSGNTNAPTMMVAEHAAAMVLADARADG